ncbi:MAG: hypothetical protein BGN91_04505 [Nitrobacter sp. 62-13]|nr:MAG: hypothetical protein BGN91_04505 [Nitrobacter sp. 62-13]
MSNRRINRLIRSEIVSQHRDAAEIRLFIVEDPANAPSLGWLWMHERGTYVRLTQSGVDLFA